MTKLTIAASLCLGLGACSGAAPPDVPDGMTISCAGDKRAETYTANMEKAGRLGAMRLVLVQSDPAPPAKGTNSWTLKVQDLGGAPVAGATVTVKPFMPDHGHGTSVVPQITPAGDGTYAITPLYLFMAGLWETTINVDAGDKKDVAVFSFCIEG